MDEDSIKIQNIVIKKKLTTLKQKNNFCDPKRINTKNSWELPFCEFNLKINTLSFSGLNLQDKSKEDFNINIEDILLDLSIFNTQEVKSLKLNLGLK